MEKPYLLHLLTPAKNPSPFDVNMALDAGWNHCIPYTGVALEEVPGLVQDAIFSRGPKGVARTGLFLGGRDVHLAMEMLERARAAMVPPFTVAVLADPSGAFTTAAAMVACAERALRQRGLDGLAGREVRVFGGTGPVGTSVGILAAGAGAHVRLVSHEGAGPAQAAAARCERYGVRLQGGDGSGADAIAALLADAEVVFSAARAGVQVLDSGLLAGAGRLEVACDVNAVPPAGIAGVAAGADGEPLAGTPRGAAGLGALAVGNIKYRTQQALLQRLRGGEAVDLHFGQALEVARGLCD
ncbi:NAD(P)-dependent methylenetetrahydromethanopterin dehydrogenase [Thioalbus denitrificans]|uniref:Methylene-tetrahydromethanopterin dehydrogenase n=1 Tax=Thioalbus denitrificans TaxID=547122 RepID=A0A369C9N1_9GAMM|nr:NAD(P)-dependent methylenetetrahydromethanopterin dehydrogenase [Thioalbus denitrificans]RCX30221.1 methylene-tetrahydromethanopterin dehydrogenase [Thioalbus denitrificans]